MRLKAANGSVSDAILEIRAIMIKNGSYGSDKLSEFEIGNGFSKPLLANRLPIHVDEE